MSEQMAPNVHTVQMQVYASDEEWRRITDAAISDPRGRGESGMPNRSFWIVQRALEGNLGPEEAVSESVKRRLRQVNAKIEDKAAIEAKAEAAGLALTHYVRRCALREAQRLLEQKP